MLRFLSLRFRQLNFMNLSFFLFDGLLLLLLSVLGILLDWNGYLVRNQIRHIHLASTTGYLDHPECPRIPKCPRKEASRLLGQERHSLHLPHDREKKARWYPKFPQPIRINVIISYESGRLSSKNRNSRRKKVNTVC